MSTLVIGGDRIETIRRELNEFGLQDIEHWDGRKPADSRKSIPERIKLVVMVTDQLSHTLLYNASISATRLGLPIIYTRRAAHELRGKLGELYSKNRPKPALKQVSSGWNLPLNNAAMSY
jgi:hypothetical protein